MIDPEAAAAIHLIEPASSLMVSAALLPGAKRPRTPPDNGAESSESPGSDSKRSAPIACDYCRTNHLRCNGTKTCSQCKKRDLDCVYPTPKKRGPKPGVNSKLKQQQLVRQAPLRTSDTFLCA